MKSKTRITLFAILVLLILCAAHLFAGVSIYSPTAGSTTSNQVRFSGAATPSSTAPITAMRVYVDGQDMYTVSSNQLDTTLTVPNGSHQLVMQAWDASGAVYKSAL